MSSHAVGQPVEKRADRRVRKTRRALGDALMGLLLEKRYEEVTVQDIIDRADVGRSTFYAHFIDKDSLLLDAFHDLRRRHAAASSAEHEGDEPFRGSAGVFRWSGDMLGQFEAADALYRAMVGSRGCALAVQEMERELDGLVRRDLARLSRLRPDRVPDMVVGFVVTAFMCILRWWLDNPRHISPDEVNQMFRVLTLPGAAAALGVAIDAGPPPAALARAAGDRERRSASPSGTWSSSSR